ncbi:hypothetical protein [Anaerobacillus arseniciselenatis]|uniref:hypothetical protein n=1 Tax=Anaerobacillus arseniciselenatis TaxID=85682 RepID=UPI001470FEB1|nr:hypothetical protein [Anaerobacillus arseniciselenatis]
MEDGKWNNEGGKVGMKIKIFFVLIVISIGFSFYYFNEYKIENDKEAIQSSLKVWLNRGSSVEVLEPNVLKVVQLENTKSYVSLFQLQEGNYGYANLIKGINGKLKIISSGQGSNIIHHQILETNRGKYIVLYGKNPNMEINSISVNSRIEEHNFKINVPTEKSFLIYKKVPDNFENPLLDEFILFDENGKEIELYQ